MSNEVRNLEPKAVWNFFEDLNAVPRASKKEERVRAFMVQFGESLGLPTSVDEIGNILITKPATPGMEDRQTVVLQGHVDMVHQKNNDTDFNFDTQGIQSFIEGDWVKAKGTTLGADNGMGVAAIMAILASTEMAHPAVEALFTIDEETGMTGAIGLKGGVLTGTIMLNMDTEEDNELTIGCAGGVDTNVSYTYTKETMPVGAVAYKLVVRGLSGGHSGMDINKELGNANRIMNRLMWDTYQNYGLRVAEIDGGGLRNAIPRESNAVVTVMDAKSFENHINAMAASIKQEYQAVEPNMEIFCDPCKDPEHVMDLDSQEKMIKALAALPNGVFRMSTDVEDLVETSSNLARVLVKDGEFLCQSLQRSSVESQKWEVARSVKAAFELMGAHVENDGSYPGWTPKPTSAIVSMMSDLYQELFSEKPHVNACHAGLECGILGTNYPGMEMISYGPTIRGAHSPDERVQISSVQKFWKYTVETMKRIPKKV